MSHPVCATCGTQIASADAPPPACPICEDPRQWVPEDGQRWTTLAELAQEHETVLRAEGDLLGVGVEPTFAIGQRALLVPWGERRVLWDCVTLLDAAAADAIEREGGVGAIAISHPHYYSGMVEWARRFACPILLHADDAEWVMRPDPAVELWTGEVRELGGGLTLVRCGGHFPGATVLHRAGGPRGGDLLAGDVVQVVPDRSHVGFMWSYPNYVPLPAAAVARVAAALEPYAFERIFGAWWGAVVRRDGAAVVQRSAQRYARALAGHPSGA